MRGEAMPKGLDLFEQAAYTSMRNLYAAYKDGQLSKDAASKEKQDIAYEYDKAVKERDFWRKVTSHSVAITNATEGIKRQIRQEPTLEAARRLVDILDGLEPIQD